METYDHVIEKSDIVRLPEMVGRVLTDGPFAGFIFDGFRGRGHPDRKFHGILTFIPGDDTARQGVNWFELTAAPASEPQVEELFNADDDADATD